MTDSTDLWARTAVRAALWALLAAGAIGAALILWLMAPGEARLREAHAAGEPPITPHGIVDWELAFTERRAREIRAVWEAPAGKHAREDLLLLAEHSLWLDRWFVLAYVATLTAACLLIAPLFPREKRRPWLVVAALPVLAGLLDATENRLLLLQLDGALWTALPAALAAAAKFALLAATGVAVIIVAAANLCRRLTGRRLEPARPFSEVVEKEQLYLRERRRKAALPETLRQEKRALGLALSGGGIRSATINLGALQALARRAVLPRFDYLSTVSGGGYIGSALSSLLSINASKIADSPAGGCDQYVFGPGDDPWFSTEHDRFPFNEQARDGDVQRLSGAVQLRHLRAAGAFLVGRRQPFSLEMLRVVGSLFGGVLYHLIHFGLFLLSFSAGYLWVIYLMVGDRATGRDPTTVVFAGLLRGDTTARFLAEPPSLLVQYADYVRRAFGLEAPGGWSHPFVLAAVVGLLLTATTLVLLRNLMPALPDDWFSRPGCRPNRSRNQDSIVALVVVMVLAAIVITWWFAQVERNNLLNISIPLVSFLGGGLCLLIGHGWVKASPRFHRPDRSRLAAQEGAFVYLTVLSLIAVLLVLPFLVFFEPLKEYLSARPLRGLGGWLLTLLGARLFAGGDQEAGGRAGKGLLARVSSFLPGIRKVLAGIAFVVAVLGAFLLMCVWIWGFETESPGIFRISVSLAALGLFCLTGLIDFNRLSLHSFYRDRLAEAYLQTTEGEPDSGCLRLRRDGESMPLTHLHGELEDGAERSTPCLTSAPYHLLVTCLNLSGDRYPRRAGRKTDQFIFSKLHCGSETTGFVDTGEYRSGGTRLAQAMTISGAAASPAMGARTFFAQSAAMTLFNVRLGYWVENPAWNAGSAAHRRKGIFWPRYLIKEILASTDADSPLVYLSDGGHSGDNLGIYPLLKRRCRLIVAIDAEYDPRLSCDSLVEALRQIRVDEGVTVDIDLAPLMPDRDSKTSTSHHAIGRIHYPPSGQQKDAETGWLVVVKSSLTGDEHEIIANYKRQNDDFPHQTTGDLFFDLAQFEAYRQLGEHLVDSVLDNCGSADWSADLVGRA